MVSGRKRVPMPPTSKRAFMSRRNDTALQWPEDLAHATEPAERPHRDANFSRAVAGGGAPHQVRRPSDFWNSERADWRRHLRPGVVDGLARRLSGPPPE